MREIDLVVLVPFVCANGELIGPGLADERQNGASVETALDEFFFEITQELGIGGRVAGPNIVNWVDDSDAEEVPPETIDVALGEIAIIR